MNVKNKVPSRGSDSLREVTRAAGSVSFGTFLSRVTGMVRDVAIAYVFGAGMMTDAFFVAFRVPNLIRRLLGEGPMSSAFIPVFTEYREKKGEDASWKLAADLTGILGGVALFLTAVGMVAAPLVVRVMAWGWDLETPKGDLTVDLTRMLFPYLFLVVLYALAMAILNCCRHFFIPAMAPALLNLGMIGGALALSPLFDPPVLGLAWGVLLGGSLQLAANIPSLRRVGYRRSPGFDLKSPGVKRVGALMVPTVIALAVNDVNQVVDTILASLLAEGSVSWLFYASRLTQFPLGLIGIALGTAILPTLSAQAARGDLEELKETISFGLRLVMFLTVPAIVGLGIFRVPVSALIFQHGQFGGTHTAATAEAVLYYGLGMWAAAGIRIVAPAFFSFKDTRTPFYVAAVAMVANVLLNLYLMTVLAHSGLALASSLAAIFQFFLLLLLLRRKIGPFGLKKLLLGVGRTILASCGMGVVCLLLLGAFPDATESSLAVRLGIVIFGVSAGIGSYLALAVLAGCEELEFMKTYIKGRINRGE